MKAIITYIEGIDENQKLLIKEVDFPLKPVYVGSFICKIDGIYVDNIISIDVHPEYIGPGDGDCSEEEIERVVEKYPKSLSTRLAEYKANKLKDVKSTPHMSKDTIARLNQ